MRVDADLVGPDGRLWMRIIGWEDWRFYWPSRYRDQFRQPDRVFVGEPLALPGASAEAEPAVRAVWLEPPADMGKPVWRDVLEWVQLGPEERAACRSLPGPEARRTLRLWGRIAAKEAARRLWADRGGPPVYPADLVLEPDPRGRPRLRSLIEPERDDLPAISIAHAEGVAVALAALDPDAPVGIDVEPVIDRPPGFDFVAFQRGRTHLARSARRGGPGPCRMGRPVLVRQGGGRQGDRPGDDRRASERGCRRCRSRDRSDRGGARPRPALGGCPTGGETPVRAVTARRGDYVWAWTMGERSRLR